MMSLTDQQSQELVRHQKLARWYAIQASTYAEQVEIHRALNLNLVPPGEQWEDYGGRGLFDELWVSEEVMTP